MKVVVAMDSFKGSISSREAGNAVMEGVKNASPECDVAVYPMGDGGEGTVDALISSMKGLPRAKQVTGPLGDLVDARYGIIDGELAVIEVASASGLTLVPKENHNPLITTTYGVGELIVDAIENGCTKFIVGLGGSATNDGGLGMLQALGFEFLNKEGKPVSLGAKGLPEIREIKNDKVDPRIIQASYLIASDVTNPLCGITGCSAIFGPQKGATPAMVKMMEKWLIRYSSQVVALYPSANKNQSGAGAAGGLGFAFATFLDGVIEPGISIVLRETNFEDKIKDADLVITGEGCMDRQTAMGKTPVGIAALAKKHNIKTVALVGTAKEDARLCNRVGITSIFSIMREAIPLDKAMDSESARKNLSLTAEQVVRLLI